MAFNFKKDPRQIIGDIINYEKFLKKDDDPSLKVFQTNEGYYLNVTRIEQTEEEKKMSEHMEKFYKNYRTILEENKDE